MALEAAFFDVRHLRKLALGLMAGWTCTASSVALAATDLYISEYIEGSGNNKAVELFNGTGSEIDLAAGGYALRIYFNGSATAGLTISLSG